ncbi:MAG TPA: FliA/WhiG family RNA polymerase sigma factor [Kofleriaceae bacterium]|nr:FliA/WhiG family RNA polymerase sigma factor [Kofleriaceae bacterium]
MLAHAFIEDNYSGIDPIKNAEPPPRADPFARMRSALVTENVHMARRIASVLARRLPPGLNDDVQSAALLGLVEAARRFHPGRGDSFPAFAAKRVRGAILDELRRGDMLPRRARQAARRVREAVRSLEQSLGRVPRDEEIAAHMGVDIGHYRDKLAGLGSVEMVSLDRVIGGSHEPGSDPEQNAMRAAVMERLGRAREQLDPRETRILAMYYDEQMTLAEIGRLLGVTESRVCQLHTRALRRLRDEMDPERGRGAERAERKRRVALAARV